MAKELLSPKDLAFRWNISLKTVYRWHCIGHRPPYIKLGITIRYRLEDIIQYEEHLEPAGAF